MSIPLRAFVACGLLVSGVTLASAGPMTAGDRQRLVAHLEMTEAWLASEVEGLSDAQLKYRMSPDTWSVTDVVEHLAIAEPQYWKNLQDSLARPAQEGFTPKCTDVGILWYGIDRTQRATMLDVARTSQDDFRSRPLVESHGDTDLYQWFLMISAHAQRHILQIREVKAHAGFPQR